MANILIKKLKARYNDFNRHPITHKNRIFSLIRYILFNIRLRIFKEIEVGWIEGLNFIVRKGDAGIIGNVYFGLDEFEESVFLLHLLEETDTFLDIGANLGHYSLLVSGIKKSHSIAIEPVTDTFQQLRKQIQLNNLSSLVDAKNIGVSNTDGMLFFSTDRGTMNRVVPEDYPNAIAIDVITIDSILLNYQTPIAMKIDVEGYEKFVLEGAIFLLNNAKLKVLVVELNQSGRKYKVSDEELYATILSFGFKPYAYHVFNRTLQELESYNLNSFNTIFVRDLSYVKSRLAGSKKIRIRHKEF